MTSHSLPPPPPARQFNKTKLAESNAKPTKSQRVLRVSGFRLGQAFKNRIPDPNTLDTAALKPQPSTIRFFGPLPKIESIK